MAFHIRALGLPAGLVSMAFFLLSIGLLAGDAPAGTEGKTVQPFRSSPVEDEDEPDGDDDEDGDGDGKDPGKDKKDDADAGEGDDDAPKAKPSSPEEAYVRDNLKGFLNPTSIAFLKDGRVKLVFDLRLKRSEHETIFTPKISSGVKSSLRWSLPREEYYLQDLPLSASSRDADTISSSSGGLKIGDSGMTQLQCWFADDIEVEGIYQNVVTYNKNQTIALTFTSDKKKGVGCNAGSQAILYKGGKPSKTAGGTQEVTSNKAYKFKMIVHGGNVESQRDGRKSASMDYDRKDLESGKVGLLWTGGASGIFNMLTITAKLDWAKTANEIKKGK